MTIEYTNLCNILVLIAKILLHVLISYKQSL